MWFLINAKGRAMAMTVTGVLFAVPHLCAGSMQSASARDTNLPLTAGGNGDSVAPWISADGRFVLFSSSACDLVSGDNSQLGLDVFLRDRASNTTVLVSANFSGNGGGNGNSLAGQVSTNGHYAMFQSDASDLLPGDTNNVGDIFVRDLQTASNILVSVAADGSWGNGASTDPVMTPDGRYVAFVSAATNLVAGDTNGIADVFVRDLVNGTTRLVSTGASGVDVSAPVMTPDGRFVAYACTTPGMAAGLAFSPTGEVFVRDLVSNNTIWASTNAANIATNLLYLPSAASYHPVISDDGRYVAFKTGWANGTVSPGAAAVIIFRYDCSNGTMSTISTSGFPAWPQNDDVYGPEMSPDGRFVVFVATNGNSACLTVQLWDAQVGTNLTVSVATDGSLPTNSISDTPAVSADGRYVVFKSNATNLTATAVSNGFHIYCRDVQAGMTQLMDVNTNGVGSANLVAAIPVMSSNGWCIAFACRDGDLVIGDKHGAFNVFVRNLNSDTTELISQHDPGTNLRTGNGLSFMAQSALSDGGRKVVFTSLANDLVPNDTNGSLDVFVYDVATGTNTLVSADLDGNPASGFTSSPVMSADGRFVAFVSTATNLVANDTNGAADIFLRDLDAGITTLVNVDSNGVVLGTGDASAPVISADGRYVAFLCKTNQAQAYPGTYWRDVIAGRTILLSDGSAHAPAMSADGKRVVWYNSSNRLNEWDALSLSNIIYNLVIGSSFAVLSPIGDRFMYQNGPTLFVKSVTGGTNEFTSTGVAPITNSSPWSADGRFITFASSAALVSNDTNGTNDVYLCDLQSGSLTLVSVDAAHTNSANGASDWPAISGDGHFVIYRSFATDLVTGNTNPSPNIFLFDRFTGSNTLITAVSPGSSWTSPRNAKPAINGDGSVVAFQSWNPNLAANDLNRVLDVFTETLQPWGTVDSDGDGIPDLWMNHYFGHPTGQAGDLSLAQDDADGTGMSNLQKYLAGLDPTNPASVFSLQIQAQISSSNNATLNWPVVPGKNYRVQFKDDLNDPVWSELPGASVVGLKGSYSLPPGPSTRFYRVIAD